MLKGVIGSVLDKSAIDSAKIGIGREIVMANAPHFVKYFSVLSLSSVFISTLKRF